MERKFKAYTDEQFIKFIRQLPKCARGINHVQIHHTWKPKKTDYKGESTIKGMWRYHTETRGWDDIGQHFTISPDGLIWDGRSLEKNPAGIFGHNEGGIMIEMIGNFDKGEEKLEGLQLKVVAFSIGVILEKFNLNYNNIVFHRDHSAKSCPGTGINKEWFINEIKGRYERDMNKIISPVVPEWKREAVEWLYKEGFLTGEDWKQKMDEPLPLWAEAIVLKRLYEKLK